MTNLLSRLGVASVMLFSACAQEDPQEPAPAPDSEPESPAESEQRCPEGWLDESQTMCVRVRELAPLPLALARPASTVLPDGRVLVAGGEGADGVVSARSFIYDPSTDSWAEVGEMSQARMKHALFTVEGTGEVLAVGGTDDDPITSLPPPIASEVFDTATATWSPHPDSTEHLLRVVAVQTGGRVLLFGGGPDSAVTIYAPETRTFSLGAREGGLVRHGANAQVLSDGLVFVGLGAKTFVPDNTSALYNAQTDSFIELPEAPMRAQESGSTAIDEGRVLIVGGESGWRGHGSWIFNLNNTSWIEAGGTSGPHFGLEQVLKLEDGTIMAVGGLTVELFDLDTLEWTTVATLAELHDHAAVEVLDEARILVIGGGHSERAAAEASATVEMVERAPLEELDTE